jgi:hypothetical protein
VAWLLPGLSYLNSRFKKWKIAQFIRPTRINRSTGALVEAVELAAAVKYASCRLSWTLVSLHSVACRRAIN